MRFSKMPIAALTAGWVALLAVPGAAMADQARTACVLLNGGTVRVLPVGQTKCGALEGTFQLVEASKSTEKTLSARFDDQGRVIEQDTITDANGRTLEWIASTDIIRNDGTYQGARDAGAVRVNFRGDVFTTGSSVKCQVNATSEVIPPIRDSASICAAAEDGGCPTPDRWSVSTHSTSEKGLVVNSRNAVYKFVNCNNTARENGVVVGYKCPNGTKVYQIAVLRPGATEITTATQNNERSAFTLSCTGY